MKRKFSFDLPKLKLGSSKPDTQPKKIIYISDLDSPIEAPQSVRPPLSPKTDNALRNACAYVLQEYKPSQQIYEEKYGRNKETGEVGYFNVLKRSENEGETNDPTAPKAPRSATKPQIARAATEPIIPGGVNSSTLKYLSNKPTHDRSTSGDVATSPRKSTETKQSRTHKRSGSDAARHAMTSSAPERTAKTTRHSDSADTTVSSDGTEGDADETWTGSTAPTSAIITPARNSVRTPAQLRLSGNEGGDKQRFLAEDAAWMTKELEKHRRIQEEMLAQQELENQVLASIGHLGLEATPGQAKQVFISSSKCPQRKPVPATGLSGQVNGVAPSGAATARDAGVPSIRRVKSTSDRSAKDTHGLSRAESQRVPPVPTLDSRQSAELARSDSRRKERTPRSESKSENLLRSDSRASRQGRERRTTHLDASENVSRSHSRARSLTRRIVEYVRPRTPRASIDASRAHSRAGSMDSTRSAASSNMSARDKWRSFRPFRRRQETTESVELSRPPPVTSKWQFRNNSGESTVTTKQKSKSKVDLNRELPPLPSLDSWKAEEPEKPQHIASQATSRSASIKKQRPAIVSASDSRTSGIPTVTSSRMPRKAVGSHSSKHSQGSQEGHDRDAVPPVPHLPSHEPEAALDQAFISNAIGRAASHSDRNANRRASRRPQDLYLPDLDTSVRQSVYGDEHGRPQIVNYTQDPNSLQTGFERRQANRRSQILQNAAYASAPPAYQDDIVEQQINFSRKPSSDEYRGAADARYYRNMIPITPVRSAMEEAGPMEPTTPVEERSRKKWWKRKSKKEETWMDQVLRAGSNSGLIMARDGAEVPIVRF